MVPACVVTRIGPVTIVAGTVAPIVVLLLTLKLVAGVPLNDTALAPIKFVPEITIRLPAGLLLGENRVMKAGR